LLPYFNVPDYFFPAPLNVLNYSWENRLPLISSLLVTLKITLGGVCTAVFLTIILTTLFLYIPLSEWVIAPFIGVLQTLPMIVFAPLFLLWFKEDRMLTLILASGLSGFFTLLSGTLNGLKQTQRSLNWVFTFYSASLWDQIRLLKIPFSLSYFFESLKICVQLCLLGALGGEFVIGSDYSQKGLAYHIMMASYELEGARLFSTLLYLIILGFFLIKVVTYISKMILKSLHMVYR
jgi:NitT/TauT family transport system permease protein